MANKSTVAGDLRRFVQFFQGLTDAADTLDKMQQIEEEATANTASIEASKKQLAAVQVEIADADRQLVDIRAKGRISVADATKRAQDKAEAVAATAAADAIKVVAAARAEGASLVGEAQTRRAELVAEIERMGEQILRMTSDRDGLAAAIASSTDELAALEGKLSAARESIAKLLG